MFIEERIKKLESNFKNLESYTLDICNDLQKAEKNLEALKIKIDYLSNMFKEDVLFVLKKLEKEKKIYRVVK